MLATTFKLAKFEQIGYRNIRFPKLTNLGSNLIPTLSDLQMYDLSHFDLSWNTKYTHLRQASCSKMLK